MMNPFKRTVVASSLVLPLLSISACNSQTVNETVNNPELIASTPKATTEVNKDTVANSINSFANDLYNNLPAGNQKNLVISPYSIASALSMTYAGAKGDTAKQMAKTLHYPTDVDIHPAFADLQQSLPQKSEEGDVLQLKVANALWYEDSLSSSINSTFHVALEKYYHAYFHPMPFQNVESALKEINEWTADNTAGKIKDLLKPGAVTPDTKLVLTNALYFKGSWQSPFDEKNTTEMPFKVAPDKSEQVPTMSQDKAVDYWKKDTFQAVELPYKKGNLSMVVVLPEEGKEPKIDDILSNLKDKPSEKQQVKVMLPKFKVEAEFQLSDVLQKLGMEDAFNSGKADFSGIFGKKDGLAIAAVVHKTFVDVNENGTEAAAATAVVMARSIQLPAQIEFRVNRPFLFLIRENTSGVILFLGRVTHPKGH